MLFKSQEAKGEEATAAEATAAEEVVVMAVTDDDPVSFSMFFSFSVISMCLIKKVYRKLINFFLILSYILLFSEGSKRRIMISSNQIIPLIKLFQ